MNDCEVPCWVKHIAILEEIDLKVHRMDNLAKLLQKRLKRGQQIAKFGALDFYPWI